MEASAKVKGLDETLRVLNRMDKEAKKGFRAEVQKMTERHAAALRQAGAGSSDPRVRHVATTAKAKKDRLPTVTIGSARKAPIAGAATATQLVYGTEFGASGRSWWRFQPGPQPWIFPTLSRRHKQIVNEWEAVVNDFMKQWVKG